MKKILYSMLAVLMAAFTLVSCEDVPMPYDEPSTDPTNPDTPTVTVDPTGSGTADDPYNVAAAIKYIEDGGSEDAEVYVKGIVVSVKEGSYDASYGSLKYYISDDGTETNQFYVFNGYKGPNRTKFSGESDLKAGDVVVICGKLVTYSSTKEFTTGNYLVSLNGQPTTSGGDEPDEPITGTNLLANGDFESWTDGQPDNWKSSCTASNATLSQSTEAHGGTYSVSVGFNASQNRRLAYKELTLKAGTYSFSIYAKSTTSDKSQCRIGYTPVTDGAAGTYSYIEDYTSLSNTEWTQITYNFTLDAATTVCLVVMNPKTSNYATAQNILVDDATLTTNDGGISDGEDPEPVKGDVFEQVTAIANGTYVIAAGDVVATPLASTYNYGYLKTTTGTVEGTTITVDKANAFTFTSVEGGYTMQDASGRYYYMTGTYNSFNVSSTMPETGAVWTVTFNDNGTVNITNVAMSKTIQYSSSYTSYGAYSSVSNTLPALYKQK